MKRMKSKYLLFLLMFCSLYLSSCSHIDKGEKQLELQEKEQGLILNIAADAIVNYSDWDGEINKRGKAFVSTGYNPDPEILREKVSKEQATTALCNYVDIYANTQVSALFFNINYQRSCFDSKVMESYWNVKDPEITTKSWARLHWILNQKGLDPYEILITHSRLRNISPWISIRMNDHHYFNDSTMINKLWWDHPEYRISPKGLFNYAEKEVRDYYKAFIQEVLERYDIDGIELDWMRTHSIFKKGEELQGAELINNFMKEIRDLTKQKSLERGHTIKIAARVPPASDIGKSFGLDGVAWVKNGFVDILIPTNWASTNFDIPVELWKNEIGTGYEYILAPGADVGIKSFKDEYQKMMHSNVDLLRGFSASAYHRGADAIYLFNNFNPVYNRKIVSPDGTINITDDKQPILKEAGKLSTSLNKPRSHVLTYNHPDNKPVSTDTPKLIQDIKNEFNIHSGTKPDKGNYTIRIGLDSLNGFENAHLEVKVNDRLCMQIDDMPRDPAYIYNKTKKYDLVTNVSETGARVMQFRADLNAVKNGYNHISIINTQKEEQLISWLEVYIE